MSKLIRKRSHARGLAPGSLHIPGELVQDHPPISVLDYNPDHLVETTIESVDDLSQFLTPNTVTWANFTGLGDTALIKRAGEIFDIHSLTLEDIVNPTQRSKFEEYDNYLYIVIRMISFDAVKTSIHSEQMSLILGDTFVLSFQEDETDSFDPLRERIRKAVGRIRSSGADYLAYALIDIIIDDYFVTLEHIGSAMEAVEEEVLEAADRRTLETLSLLNRELILLRRGIWPARELIGSMLRSESKLIEASTGPFMRDAYDHTIQIMEIVESFRDVVSGLRESYKTTISNRMNDIMKVLTIIATIFIPLTFIAGIYGMNFEYMPELGYRNGYFIAWGAMITVGIGLALYFKKKEWF